jgi:hypothetical protein
MDQSILAAGIHPETPLNIDLKISNKRQNCKIGTVGLWEGSRWTKEIKVIMVDKLHLLI